jgi:hypothetical protein
LGRTILRQGGHEIVAASPKSGINVFTGEGLILHFAIKGEIR